MATNVQTQTVQVYTRHGSKCKFKADITSRKCKCPKWLYVYEGEGRGAGRRISAKTRSWEEAEKEAQKLRDDFDPVKRELKRLKEKSVNKTVAITDVADAFRNDSKSRGIAEETYIKNERCVRHLCQWLAARNSGKLPSQRIETIDQITTPLLTEWRIEWRDKSILSRRNKQERVRSFFKWCVDQGYLTSNPAKGLSRIVGDDVAPTHPFTPEQFEKLVDATYLFDNKSRASLDTKQSRHSQRLRALILLMRWSGLAIMDAVTLPKNRVLKDGTVQTYRKKTGVWVTVPLPPDVVKELNECPAGNVSHPDYFFWTGVGKKRVCVNNFARSLRRLFAFADLKMKDADGNPIRPHSHMLRDTFAVELLKADVRLEHVSILLGHESIKTTEKSYAPFVTALQKVVTNVVRNSWGAQGVEAPVIAQQFDPKKKSARAQRAGA
jgi:integrase/recombinase XerD